MLEATGHSLNYYIAMGLALVIGTAMAGYTQKRLPYPLAANVDGRFWRLAPLYGMWNGGMLMMASIIVWGMNGKDTAPLALDGVKAAAMLGFSMAWLLFMLVSKPSAGRSYFMAISRRPFVRLGLLALFVAVIAMPSVEISDAHSIRQLQFLCMSAGGLVPFILGRYFVWLAGWFG